MVDSSNKKFLILADEIFSMVVGKLLLKALELSKSS